jgi:hypothetical protein
MESEVRIVSLHIPILPATGATESGKTRARILIGKTSRKQKGQNKYNVIAKSIQ